MDNKGGKIEKMTGLEKLHRDRELLLAVQTARNIGQLTGMPEGLFEDVLIGEAGQDALNRIETEARDAIIGERLPEAAIWLMDSLLIACQPSPELACIAQNLWIVRQAIARGIEAGMEVVSASDSLMNQMGLRKPK